MAAISKRKILFVKNNTLFYLQYSSLVWLNSYYVGNAFGTHEYITEQTKILPYPSPLHFSCAQSVVSYAQTQCSFVPHTHIYKLLSSISFAV